MECVSKHLWLGLSLRGFLFMNSFVPTAVESITGLEMVEICLLVLNVFFLHCLVHFIISVLKLISWKEKVEFWVLEGKCG